MTVTAETLDARPCSLCREAEKQPADTRIFFLKDVNPTKPGRWRENAALLSAGAPPVADVDAIHARWRDVADASWVGQR